MKTIIAFGFLLVVSTTFAQTLSLKDKQLLSNLDFSFSEKRLLDNYGTAVKIEMDKLTFAGDEDAILYADSRGATRVSNAISSICDYKVGKEAITEKKLTKIVLKNIKEGKHRVELKAGVLTVFAGFSSSDNYFGESELKEAIENLL